MTLTTASPEKRRRRLHPFLVMLTMLLAALVLTHIVPSGKYARDHGAVVPGSYKLVPKERGFKALFSHQSPTGEETPARAAGVSALFLSVPAGMTKTTGLIFMVMFVGGMFGILQATGSVDAGIDRLLQRPGGNVYLLTSMLMLTIACGATFLGLLSEYVAIIPLVLAIAQRLGLPNLFAAAVVILGSAIGYSASITNPIVLAVAQPLAHVPIFSGMVPRLAIFCVMFAMGLAFMFRYLRRMPVRAYSPDPTKLTRRQVCVLLCVGIGTAVLVIGTGLWSWGTTEHAALFLAWAFAIAVVGGLASTAAADAFIDGMKLMLLPAVMIGLAGAIAIILQNSQVLDTVVHMLAIAVEGHAPGTVGGGILVGEMFLDVLVNSTSAKAAISLPILTPIAHLAGIGGNVSVSALTMAGSLTNMITPTNGALLAFLSAAKVDYAEWARFAFPLFIILFVAALAIIQVMVVLGC